MGELIFKLINVTEMASIISKVKSDKIGSMCRLFEKIFIKFE